MLNNDGFSGVSNCYVFKSQLQEYAQKAQLPTPVYETIKEGPSHEPSFRSTVIVNDIRYDSLPGFFNRKAAEQSAAEVALVELAKSREVNQCISLPVHETGLCKNLLQEYAQKMNYAIPLYKCQKDETPCRASFFKCTVEIGGIQYIGASAKTKKEAEIKAARTALLAIQSTPSSDKQISNHQLTVIPCKKRGAETTSVPKETANVPKAKRARFKKKTLKKKLPVERVNNTQSQVMGNQNLVAESGLNSDRVGVFPIQVAPYRQLTWGERYFQDRKFVAEPSGKETSGAKCSLALSIASNYKSERSVGVDIAQGKIMGNQDLVAKSGSNSDQVDAYPVQIARYGSITLGESYFQDERFVAELNRKETSDVKDSQTSPIVGNSIGEQSVAADFTQYCLQTPIEVSIKSNGYTTEATEVREVVAVVNNSTLAQLEASDIMAGLKPLGKGIEAAGASQG